MEGSGRSAWEPTRAAIRIWKDTPCTRSISGAGAKPPRTLILRYLREHSVRRFNELAWRAWPRGEAPAGADIATAFEWANARWENVVLDVPHISTFGRRGGPERSTLPAPSSLTTLRARVAPQPQRSVGGLHRLTDDLHQVDAKPVQICLIPELGRECL